MTVFQGAVKSESKPKPKTTKRASKPRQTKSNKQGDE